MNRVVLGIFSISVLIFAGGCFCSKNSIPAIPAATVVKASAGEIVFDGKLDEDFWRSVPAYELVRCDGSGRLPELERKRILQDKLEKTTVKFAFDDNYFYVAASVEDKDIVAVTSPQKPTAVAGDNLQIILVPENGMYYWELFSAPNGTAPAYLYHIHGLYLSMKDKENFGKVPGYGAVCKLNGTLNRQNDRDKGWSAEIRLPLSVINKDGIRFAPGEKWRVLVYRINYSAYNYAVQTAAFPQLPGWNLNLRKYFAPVAFR